MKVQPLISVIVPIYKVEDYLDECIQSIVSQTYNELEIILVDDGSPDRCPELCDEWAKKDARIKVIHKLNGGLSSARNVGIDVAQGQYFAFIDSDDYVAIDYIERMYTAIIKDDFDLVVCQYENVNEHNSVLMKSENMNSSEEYSVVGKEVILRMIEAQLHYTTFIDRVEFIVAWNKLYKSSVWKDLRYPVGKINEDEYVCFDVLGQCNSIKVLPDKLYYYRQRTGSIMSSERREKTYSANLNDVWTERMKYVNNQGLKEYAQLLAEQIYIDSASALHHFALSMDKKNAKLYACALIRARRIKYPSMLKSVKDKVKWNLIEMFPWQYCLFRRLLAYRKYDWR